MNTTGARALIVEDDSLWTTILERLLAQEGIESVIANDATQARAQLRNHEFGVILLDLQLPGQEGLPLIDEVQRDARIAQRCIVVTAHARVAGYFSPQLPVVDKTRISELVSHVRRIIVERA